MDNSFGINFIPENDQERIAVLKRYKIVDTPAEKAFDHIVRLATQIFNVPVALISLVDTDRVFYKANIGMEAIKSIERERSLCAQAILNPEVLVSDDSAGYQFYAGAPLTTPDGFRIGTVCIVDTVSRTFSAQDKEMLQSLATIAMDEIELRLGTIDRMQHRIESMFMNASMGMTILRSRDLIVEIANQPMFDIWNRSAEQIIGKKIMDVFPELEGQPFPKMLDEIFNTGKTIAISEIDVEISTDAGNKHIFVDFKYAPLFDISGAVESVMVTVIDITEIVRTRQLLESSEEEQQSLNEELNTTVEELAAANEELASANEEMMATNEELAEIHSSLYHKVAELAESESRFRYMIERAPVAMLVLRGENMVFEIVNPMMQKLLDKGPEIIGKDLATALPEVLNQPILAIIQEVYRSGEPYYGFEAAVVLNRNGVSSTGYFDFVYTPLTENGQVTGILQVVTEITDQIEIRNKLQKSEEMLRFSIESANVGTWYFDIDTETFNPSGSLKKLFGYGVEEEMTYQNILERISEDYRPKVIAAASGTIYKGANYNVEFPATGLHDQKLRWLKAIGKLDLDPQGKLAHFSGVVIDVTEQKQDEIRKNDFIAMVSHELKTPLTSLKGYLQLLTGKAKKTDDAFTINALERGNTQINKMTAMINGFLNLSRLEAGKIHLDKHPFGLKQLMKDMVDEMMMTTQSHDIVLLPGPDLTINADADKIGQVISNFLSNAVKYSPLRSRIEVAAVEKNGMIQVMVKDQGMGINPEDIDKLFDRFYRVENQHAQNISGFGIGLYLCAEIVNRHDGQIWVESENGKGSIFYFSIPAYRNT